METPSSRLLMQKKDSLVESFLDNGPEFCFMDRLTDCLDEYFCSVFVSSRIARHMMGNGDPFVIIALGGYGRREQCIHSDIDLLILFEDRIPSQTESFVQDLLYPLWDAKFEVGYAVRTRKEALKMAFSRFDVLTTVLDARFLCGDRFLYSRFLEDFRAHLKGVHMERTMTRLLDYGQKRLTDFGDSSYLVAPNLKSGFGGLREYHTLLWCGKLLSPVRIRNDLEYYGFLSHFEYNLLEESLGYIWHVRSHLHLLTGRKCDILHVEYQTRVAQRLGYETGSSKTGVEKFLGDLHSRMEFLKQVSQITSEHILTRSQAGQSREASNRPSGIRGLVIRKNRLFFVNTLVVLQHPDLLIKIFLESGKTRIPLSIESRRVVSEFLHLVDDSIRSRPDCLGAFKKILALSFWEFNVLNVMLSTGILERLIPEFTAIKDKIQYNQYHLFPVDKHSIRCVQVINGFRTSEGEGLVSLYRDVFKEVQNKSLLLLAALLHDIGKSDPACEHSVKGSEMARPIFQRLGFGERDVNDGALLIRHHLLIVKTATRRDVFDEETAMFLANKVGSIRVLRMLYLLTVADSQATGPKAWNRWTEHLIKDLFFNTLTLMKEKNLVSRRNKQVIAEKRERVIKALKQSWTEDELTCRLDAMPHRYFLEVSHDEILQHMGLVQSLKGAPFVCQVAAHEDTDTRTVSIYGKNAPGFYSKAAGVFFLNGIDVKASQAYSMGSGYLLDVFTVTPPQDRIFEKEKWKKIQKDVLQALEEDHFLDQVLDKIPKKLVLSPGVAHEPSRVRIDNETSSFFTIIEVVTYDFSGLLFLLTNTLYRNGLDVHAAMVGGKVDQVIDIFYVRGLSDNRKIQDADVLNRIQNHIMDNLPEIEVKE